MKEYIERSAAMNQCEAFSDERARISKLPAADVAPVVHGEWVKEHNRIGDDDYQCSHCKGYACESGSGFYDVLTDYCPNCGARMDGGK